MAPAMKAMKKAVGATGLTASAAFTKVAETAELKPKSVKVVVTKNGKLGGVLNMKLKKKPANAARKGVNPSTKEPRVFKAKESSRLSKQCKLTDNTKFAVPEKTIDGRTTRSKPS